MTSKNCVVLSFLLVVVVVVVVVVVGRRSRARRSRFTFIPPTLATSQWLAL